MAKKPKTIIEKAADFAHEVLHPSAPHAEKHEDIPETKAIESSDEKKDYQSHPKFAKFNSQGEHTP